MAALAAGSRIGQYEVISAIGAGGMGEVYRARDTKLGRDVALKILPDSFAADPEWTSLQMGASLPCARFERRKTCG
jgi:serine/threonine protein kinase